MQDIAAVRVSEVQTERYLRGQGAVICGTANWQDGG